MDISDIGSGLTAADFALKTIQRIRDLSKASDNIELREAITDLREALIDIKNENIDLKQQIQKIENTLDIRKKLKLRKNVYWSEDEDIPYCQVCLERDGKFVHLHYTYNPGSKFPPYYKCKVCDKTFDTN